MTIGTSRNSADVVEMFSEAIVIGLDALEDMHRGATSPPHESSKSMAGVAKYRLQLLLKRIFRRGFEFTADLLAEATYLLLGTPQKKGQRTFARGQI